MTLKICSCNEVITTKNAKRVIRYTLGLNFNCPKCETTKFLKDKKVSIKNLPKWFQYEIKN